MFKLLKTQKMPIILIIPIIPIMPIMPIMPIIPIINFGKGCSTVRATRTGGELENLEIWRLDFSDESDGRVDNSDR
ncbi:hypothetical protein RCZ04_00120 [Capnocytophaga sp. HP1101]